MFVNFFFRWGGCVVALTSQEKIEETLENLYQYYYKDILEKDNLKNVVFVVTAGDGAEVINL